jgi:hypothetical protein
VTDAENAPPQRNESTSVADRGHSAKRRKPRRSRWHPRGGRSTRAT